MHWNVSKFIWKQARDERYIYFERAVWFRCCQLFPHEIQNWALEVKTIAGKLRSRAQSSKTKSKAPITSCCCCWSQCFCCFSYSSFVLVFLLLCCIETIAMWLLSQLLYIIILFRFFISFHFFVAVPLVHCLLRCEETSSGWISFDSIVLLSCVLFHNSMEKQNHMNNHHEY